MRAHSVTFSMLACNGKGSGNYTNAAFLSSRRHNLSSKLKLRNNQTVRIVYVDARMIRFFQKEVFSRFIPSSYAWYVRLSIGDAGKVARWRQLIHYFSFLTFRFCVTHCVKCYDYNYCKVVQWYSMRLVCIVGYFLNVSCKFYFIS